MDMRRVMVWSCEGVRDVSLWVESIRDTSCGAMNGVCVCGRVCV